MSTVVLVPTFWHKIDCSTCGHLNVGMASEGQLIACPICGDEDAGCYAVGRGRSNKVLPWIQTAPVYRYGHADRK